jgi:hypothetical protein
MERMKGMGGWMDGWTAQLGYLIYLSQYFTLGRSWDYRDVSLLPVDRIVGFLLLFSLSFSTYMRSTH